MRESDAPAIRSSCHPGICWEDSIEREEPLNGDVFGVGWYHLTLSEEPLITQRTLAPFRGILFDMDGVLLDSEPFWRLAQMEVFAELGKHLTEADCVETTGIRIDQVVAYRVPQADRKATVRAILDRMIYLVEERGRPIAGVRETLAEFEDSRFCLAEIRSPRLDLALPILENCYIH